MLRGGLLLLIGPFQRNYMQLHQILTPKKMVIYQYFTLFFFTFNSHQLLLVQTIFVEQYALPCLMWNCFLFYNLLVMFSYMLFITVSKH